MGERRPAAFYILASIFAAYVLFLYGPMIAVFVLSFQGPTGGLTFPMNGVSLHWFHKLFAGNGTVDIGAAFLRSLRLGLVVMAMTVALSVAEGMAFRKPFRGSSILLYAAIGSLIVRVRACDVPVLELDRPGSDARAKISAEIKAALATDRAEAIVLGCAGMADLAAELSVEHGVSVFDGVACAVALAESLARLGLRTSKRGGYAAPGRKTYAGVFASFAPR